MSSGRRSQQEAGNNNTGNAEPFYTNEDVAILHDIVVLAQELLPNLPERERLPTNALFSAYYDILPRVGINSDHDSRYARILFKIGGLRGQEMLYEKFEEILSRMGIEIEFDQGAEQQLSNRREDSQTDLDNAEARTMEQDEVILSRGRRRRNSESSAWELRDEIRSKSKARRNSYSFLDKAEPIRFKHHPISLQDFLPTKPQLRNHSTGTPNEIEDKPRSHVGTWLNAGPDKPRSDRGRSVSTHASMRVRRGSPSLVHTRLGPGTNLSNPTSDEYQAQSEITAVTSAHDQETSDSVNLNRDGLFIKPSGSLMQIKAEVILQHHLSFLAKRQLRIWRDQALQLREDNANLDLLALHHDKSALLNQALDTWHSRLLEKRNIADTERFFAHLERRSCRARDLYLLHKAFTHWNTQAYEEAERTSAARRHILRIRTFNAWRDITAIKELKVRRQVLKKFFAVWKRQHIAASDNTITALLKYEVDLVKKIFQRWVWKVGDIKAGIWWAEEVKQRTFCCWTIAARNALEGHRTASKERGLRLSLGAWRIWKSKTNERIKQNQRATSFRLAHLCFTALRKWRRETRVVPAKNALQVDVATRLLREAFTVWQHRSLQERQAAAADSIRIIRGAWTHWRHKFRFQVLHARVEDRMILVALYKWVLNERMALAKRLFDQRLLRNCLRNWVWRCQALREQRRGQENLAQSFAIQKTQASILGKLSSRAQFQQQLETDATDCYTVRLLQGILSHWPERARHVRHLQQWSRDAEFYFFASKALKRWKSYTEAAKREKRKAVYIQVRRRMKENLARGLLFRWRYQTQQILNMHAQARNVRQNRNVVICMNIFDRWRACTEELEEMESLWREKVLRKSFVAWRDRSTAFQDLKVEAIINFQERRQGQAVKKWNLLILQQRAQSRYANDIRGKNTKRRFRKILNYWRQRTAEKQPLKKAEILERGDAGHVGNTARAQAWSDFGDETEINDCTTGLDEPIASISVPGYLTTPSKRTERVAAAAARFSSNTPRAPLPTPLERHLRVQYSGGLPTSLSLRRRLGRSTLEMGGGFSDIADGSKNDERKGT